MSTPKPNATPEDMAELYKLNEKLYGSKTKPLPQTPIKPSPPRTTLPKTIKPSPPYPSPPYPSPPRPSPPRPPRSTPIPPKLNPPPPRQRGGEPLRPPQVGMKKGGTLSLACKVNTVKKNNRNPRF